MRIIYIALHLVRIVKRLLDKTRYPGLIVERLRLRVSQGGEAGSEGISLTRCSPHSFTPG